MRFRKPHIFKLWKCMFFIYSAFFSYATLLASESQLGSKSLTPNSNESKDEDPVEVLLKLVKSDYEASDVGEERMANAIFTHEEKSFGPKPGFYQINWDAFEVASSWHLLKKRDLSNTSVECSVQFHIVGYAKGVKTNEKGIEPISNVITKIVIYKLKKTAEGWKVIDPQGPVIGIDPLKNFYKKQFDEVSIKISSMEANGKRPYSYLLALRELAEKRLKDIEAISKLKEK